MKTDEFRTWLQESPLNPNPIKDCISRCRRVEKALAVDLDLEYQKDHGKSLMASLTYTPKDQRNNKEYPAEFNFKSDANIRFRFTDLRSAVRKYFSFCDSLAVE